MIIIMRLHTIIYASFFSLLPLAPSSTKSVEEGEIEDQGYGLSISFAPIYRTLVRLRGDDKVLKQDFLKLVPLRLDPFTFQIITF